MSEITRKGLELIVNTIGRAKNDFISKIGNTSKKRAALLSTEKLVVKLRGSSIFHDYDFCQKDPNTGESVLPTFDVLDNVGFGIQGGEIVIDPKITKYGSSFYFNPTISSPPCLEGWNYYDYNAWSRYIPPYNASGLANTAYVIYGTEPYGGSGRTQYTYPIKYSGGYSRVPLFNCCRYISFGNGTPVSPSTEVHLVVDKKYFEGSQHVNPLNNIPIDLGIYYYPSLYTSSYIGPILGSLSPGDQPVSLGYTAFECNSVGSATSTNKNFYFFKVKFPSSLTNSIWYHLLFYFGTHDLDFVSSYPSYSAGNAVTYDNSTFQTSWYVGPKKSFFKKDFNSYLTFEKTGINDSNVYLFSKDKTHFELVDGQYSEPVDPFRYKINETIINDALLGDTNSLSGLSTPEKFDFMAVSLATRNSGNLYENPLNDIKIFYSSPMPIEMAVEDWSNFDYYPEVDDEYDVICNIILQYPDLTTSGTINVNNDNQAMINNCSIIYIEMKADNFAKPVLGNSDIAAYLFNPFYKILQNLRSNKISKAFDVLGFSMIPYSERMNTNNFKNISQFSDTNLAYYKILHNILKKPSDSLLKNSSEPYAIQFPEDSLQSLSDWSVLSPSTNIATLYSNELTNNKIKLPVDSEFEIYQEQSYLCEAINVNLSGNKIGQDYTFRIKFENSKENYLTKDIYVNNSTFYLTDQEYQDRLNKNLSMIGYYKQSTLSNIESYRLYGYAGVIPDLSMGEYRVIDTKVVNPVDSTITSEDYVPDLSKYSNKFTTIKDIGVSVSQYSYSTEPYWINNFFDLVGCTNIQSIVAPEDVHDIFGDSFTIASYGYDTEDGSINYIENICENKNTVDLASSLNQLTFAGYKDISESSFAIKISPSIDTDIKNFKIKLLKTTNVSNQYAYVEAQLWTNDNGLPGAKIISGSKVYLDTINNSIENFDFNLFYNLKANSIYWIVFVINKYPSFYDVFTTGLVNVSGTAVTGVYDYTLQTDTKFTKYNTNSFIGFGSTNPTNISSWYTINSISSDNSMAIDNTGTTLTKQNYVIKHKLQIGIKESSIGPVTPYNLAFYNSVNGWVLSKGTAYIQFFTPTLEVLGAFNRTIDGTETLLPPPNRMREDSPSYQVDGYWSYTCKDVYPNSKVAIYPRAIYLQSKQVSANGIIGTNYITVSKENFPSQILIGSQVFDGSSFNHIPNNTFVTSISYDSGTEIYTIYFSNNIIASFPTEIITFGENKYVYVKRSKDIHLIVRYYINSKLTTKHILLEKSPTWTTKWYQRSSSNYTFLDEGLSADAITHTNNLVFSNYDVNGQYEYLNGIASGIFIPKTSIAGNTYTFRIQCSGGYRLYINGSATPLATFDNWTNTSLSTSTGSITVTNPIEFRLEFTHSTGTQYLSFQYNDGSGYKNIDYNFYDDPIPAPVLIDDEPIQRLAYLVVGKSYEDINTNTLGAPPGDRIVFRSK